MNRTNVVARPLRHVALCAGLLLAGCSSGSGAPAGGGNNNTGGTPPPPTGFAVFSSDRANAGVFEPWIASYDGADLRALGALLPDDGATVEWGCRLSSDGRHLAAVTAAFGEHHYTVVDVEAGTARTLPFVDFVPTNGAYFTFSPDGERLLLTRKDGAGDLRSHLMDADGSNDAELTFGAAQTTVGSWSPTSEHFLCRVRPEQPAEESLYLCRKDGMIALDLMPAIGQARNSQHYTWSADGSRLAFEFGSEPSGGGDPRNQLWLYDPATTTLEAKTSPVEGLANHGLSADGATVAYSHLGAGANRTELYVTSTLGGAAIFVAFDPTGAVEWAPAGDHLAFFTFDAVTSTQALHVADSSGATRRLDGMLTSGQFVTEMRWSPDGRWLAFVADLQLPRREIWVADVTAPDPPVLVADGASFGDGRRLCWSPDGGWLYAIQRDLATQRDELHAWPAGDWAAVRSLGDAVPGSLVNAPGPFVSAPYEPTPDSLGVVWRRPVAGTSQVDVLYGRPDDPGGARVISSATLPASGGGVRQLFAR
ncbi:MAG: PD40 domain-containing protein [Planctomycetes bacterium]|nr:PD40 domain-containing protein [Planctomycetota bacterium]